MKYLVFQNCNRLQLGARPFEPPRQVNELQMHEFYTAEEAVAYVEQYGGYIVKSLDLLQRNHTPLERPKPNPPGTIRKW